MDRRLAVLGSPIDHSKSPAIHSAAYRVLNLPWSYERVEINPGALRPFVESLDESWLGLSVTMPLKEEAARLASVLDPVAQLTGAVNTLVRQGDLWAGFNTDVFGLVQAITKSGIPTPKTVLIVGSGATAYSAIVAVRDFAPDAKITLHARNEATRSQLLWFARDLGLSVDVTANLSRALKKSDLCISTLPAQSLDSIAEQLLSKRAWQPKGSLFDVAYQPWPSELAKLWLRNRNVVVSGIEMLYWQAIAQVRIFVSGSPELPLTQESASLEAMRHALELNVQ